MGLQPEEVEKYHRSYEQMTDRFGRPPGSIRVMGGLALDDGVQLRRQIESYEGAGVDGYVCSIRYQDVDTFHRKLDSLASATN